MCCSGYLSHSLIVHGFGGCRLPSHPLKGNAAVTKPRSRRQEKWCNAQKEGQKDISELQVVVPNLFFRASAASRSLSLTAAPLVFFTPSGLPPRGPPRP